MIKKQCVTLIAVALTASNFLFSCHDRMNKNTGELTFDSIQVNRTAYLFNDTAKPGCNLTIRFAFPVQSSDKMLKDSLEACFVTACFGEKYKGWKPEEVVGKYTENYINDYRRDLEPIYLEDEKNNLKSGGVGSWYAYYKNIESNVQLYEGNLLVYRVYSNDYTGGAHGMYTTSYLNIDLTEKRSLHLEDLFVGDYVGDYKEALTNLIWEQLMADNKVTSREALEDLGFGSTGEITPIENFYLSRNGVTFFYNVYDITPYAMGPVKVTIPFVKMEQLLSNHPILKMLQ